MQRTVISDIEKSISSFRSHIDSDFFLCLFDFLLETGCKINQAVATKFSDIDGCFYIPKKIELSNDLCKRIIAVQKNKKTDIGSFIFCTTRNLPITPRRVQQLFSHYSEKSGIKITPRTLRKCFIIKKAMSSISKERLSKLAGTKISPIKDLSIDKNMISSKRDQTLFSILKETGCTTSELCSIKKKHLVFSGNNHYIIFVRYKKSISKELFTELIDFSKKSKDTDHVFSSRKNKPLSQRRVQQIFSSISKNTKQNITPRGLRKNYAWQRYTLDSISVKKMPELLGIKRIDVPTYGLLDFSEIRLGIK